MVTSEIQKSIIKDAKDGLTAEEIAEKYDTSLKIVYRYAKGCLSAKAWSRKKNFKKGTTRREYDLLKCLGMDYVEARKE